MVLQARPNAEQQLTDYGSTTSHNSSLAGTKNSNILENKQTMEDSHTDPQPYVGSVQRSKDPPKLISHEIIFVFQHM